MKVSSKYILREGEKMEYLLTFPNTHYAVQAEQVLLTRKVAVRVFTLPPSLTDGCGIGLLINEAEITHSVCFLEEAKVRVASIFSVKNDLGERRYQLSSP